MVDFRAEVSAPAGRRRQTVHPAILCAGAAHRRLRAEFSRPHGLQRPDPSRSKRSSPSATPPWGCSRLRFCSFLFGSPASRLPASPTGSTGATSWRSRSPFWSAMTFLCGMLERGNAGARQNRRRIGESAEPRQSQSMVKNERPRALGIFAMAPISGCFSAISSAACQQHYGWRMAFFTAGLARASRSPAILWLTISEPKRGADGGDLCARIDRADPRSSPRKRPSSSC